MKSRLCSRKGQAERIYATESVENKKRRKQATFSFYLVSQGDANFCGRRERLHRILHCLSLGGRGRAKQHKRTLSATPPLEAGRLY